MKTPAITNVVSITFILFFLSRVEAGDSQVRGLNSQLRNVPEKSQQLPEWKLECEKLVAAVQNGLQTSDASVFSGKFDEQVRVSLPGAERGIISSSQAHYVVQSYLKSRKVHSVHLSLPDGQQEGSYASGGMKVQAKGVEESAGVYISFINRGGRWVISEINIY